MERRLDLAALVLAAGAGSRYSDEPGAKLLASLGGRPILQHVLDEVRAVHAATTVVVLGHGIAAIEKALDWSDELRVINHAPDVGMASSLQIGIDTLRAMPQPVDGAWIVLGDQPRLRAETMLDLARAAAGARPADRPLVIPRYDEPGPRNPVLLLRPAWSWIDELDGDHGLGPFIEQRSDQVLEVPIEGTMPDVDTPDDLARLAQEPSRDP